MTDPFTCCTWNLNLDNSAAHLAINKLVLFNVFRNKRTLASVRMMKGLKRRRWLSLRVAKMIERSSLFMEL